MRKARLDTAALIVLLAITGLRPLISETFSTEALRITARLVGTEQAWVTTTIILDALVLLVATGVLAGRLTARGGGGGYRPTGLEWGGVLLTVAAFVSAAVASAKRPAWVASIDLVACIALALALVQLMDKPWKVAFALGVLVAASVANTAECADQRLVSFAETERDYYARREQLWDVPLDSPQVRLFEQRMLAREASGYFEHSNVAGGYLLLGAFAALGVAIAGLRLASGMGRALAPLACGALAAATFAAVWLTRGKGALVAAVAGLMLLGACLLGERWIARRRRAVLVGGWVLVLLTGVGTVALGVARGRLPSPSLAFRWQYWTAAAQMFGDHPLVGVGAENFGDYYLQYKTITSPEEVKNPHSLPVQIATEFGLFGLLGLAMMLAGASRALMCPPRDWATEARGRSQRAGKNMDPGLPPGARIGAHALPAAGFAVIIALLVFGPRTRLLSSSDPAFIYWMTVFPLLFWLPALLIVVVSCRRVLADSRASAMLATAVNCGLLAFLLQDTINFALFVPGARMSCFALLAIALALRDVDRPAPSRHRRTLPVVAFAIAGIGVAVAAVNLPAPVRAERALRAARAAAQGVALDGTDADALYAQAIAFDPYDATAPAEYARRLFAYAQVTSRQALVEALISRALTANEAAIARDRRRVGLWRDRARLYLFAGLQANKVDDYRAAVDAARQAVALYPVQPEVHVELGDCLAAVNDCASLEEAAAEFELALAWDDARPDWEEYRRLTPAQRAGITARLEAVELRRAEQCPSEPPP